MIAMLPLLLLGCGPKHLSSSPTADDYFPLGDGYSWSYAATFNGQSYPETRVSVAIEVDGAPVYVFLPAEDLSDDTAMVFSGSFGLGAYRREGGGVETANAMWREEVAGLSPSSFQHMLTLPPQVGEVAPFDTPSVDRSGGIIVQGYETVTVPAGTFEDCLRIELGEDSYAWLAPGVGLVKWVLVTGRVEELESFTFAR